MFQRGWHGVPIGVPPTEAYQLKEDLDVPYKPFHDVKLAQIGILVFSITLLMIAASKA